MIRKIDFHAHFRGTLEWLDDHVERDIASGVDRVVIFDTGSADQSLTLEAAAKFPDHYIPFFNVDWETDDGKAVNARKAEGFVGAKLILPPAPYDHDEFFDLYEGLARNRMVALFHTAVIAGSGSEKQKKKRPSSRWMRPVHLDRIARTFPEMAIVGAHIGYPWYAEACAVMRWHKNVWFDTSTSQLTYNRRDYIRTGPEIGAKPIIRDLYVGGDLEVKKVVYGSDQFLPDSERSVTDYAIRQTDAAMDDLEMPEEVRSLIYRENAEAILRWAGIDV